MAGVTNSAFRRLVSGFGGYGALFTEMLSGSAFLHEQPDQSPFTKRRPEEGHVIYQFRLSGNEDIERVFTKIQELGCLAVDINLGCPAPEIQRQASGAALFRDFGRLKSVLARARSVYHGSLTAKCRLGDGENWQAAFKERLLLFEEYGLCALTVHPRLSTEALRRRARWEAFPWIAQSTNIPIIGNGDVCSSADIEKHMDCFGPLKGLMLGRIVAVKPWVFREFAEPMPIQIDYAEVWDRLYRYTLEDMPPEKAFGRLKEFTHYFAGNFVFGHVLRKAIQKAKTPHEIRDAAMGYLSGKPELRVNVGIP
jgi:tRNA-dihydrouridine synthase